MKEHNKGAQGCQFVETQNWCQPFVCDIAVAVASGRVNKSIIESICDFKKMLSQCEQTLQRASFCEYTGSYPV